MAGFGRILSTASNCLNLISSRSVIPNLQQCATLKGKALEKLGLPPKPKKPMSSFLRFIKIERAKNEYNNSSLKETEKIQAIAKKWATFDPIQKEELRKQYDLDMIAYTKQMITYEQSLTAEHKQMVTSMIKAQEEKAEKQERRKRCIELGKPKRPPTGFLQFLQENKYSMKNGDTTKKQFIKDMALEWNSMSPEEKSKYKMESNRLMVQYKQDMREWEEKMVKNGHIDVVRNRGLMYMKTNNQQSTH